MKDKKKKIGFSFAWNGLKEVVAKERNFRIHLIFASVVIASGLFFRLSIIEWALVFIVIGFVLVMEMVNTIVERIIDYVKPEYHIQAKLIKDLAAACVLVAALFAVIIGLFVFLPKLISFF